MTTEPLLLVETLPLTFITALGTLPKRLLFQNSCVQLVLVGVKTGQELANFQSPVPLLLVVTFGQVTVDANGWRHRLGEGDQFRLEPRTAYEVQALEASDLLFYIPGSQAPLASLPEQKSPVLRPTGERKPAITNDKPAAALLTARG